MWHVDGSGWLGAIKSRWIPRAPGPEDIEIRPWNGSPGSANDRQRCLSALACLFDFPLDQLEQWPGIFAYGRFLETCFQPLLSDDYAALWTSLARQRPGSVKDCWPLFQDVATTIRRLDDHQSSIEELWNDMALQHSIQAGISNRPQDETPAVCAMTLFAILCWSTMTFRPQLMRSNEDDFPSLKVNQQPRNQKGLKMDYVQRPLTAIFRNLQHTMKTSRWRHAIGRNTDEQSTVLRVPSLNFASLHIIGKIRLVWVDNITCHLDFDATNRQLSVFKFPTFCALTALADSKSPSILTGVLQAIYDSDDDDDPNSEKNSQVHREVLMSYRLLFAQSRKARTLLRRNLRELREKENFYDPFLEVVCSRATERAVRALPAHLWPVPCRGDNGSVLEQSSYSSQDDFPLFGQRLAKLQEFSLRQQPSRLRDLWRDRRNPLQWYTFWAVLIVGGVTILLGILQLLVGVLQVVYSARSCSCP